MRLKMRYNEIETGNNDVKIGNNGLIPLECCFGRDCCFRELVQYRFLHDHKILWHSLFCCRVFIAICRFAAGIQINPGLPGPLGDNLGHARRPILSAIHHMRMACLMLYPRRQASVGYLAGYGPWHEHPLAHRSLLLTASSSWWWWRPALRATHKRHYICRQPARVPCCDPSNVEL